MNDQHRIKMLEKTLERSAKAFHFWRCLRGQITTEESYTRCDIRMCKDSADVLQAAASQSSAEDDG